MDPVPASITIITEQPPARVAVPAGGNIDQIFVIEKQLVEAQAPLALLENPAHYADILTLKQWLAFCR